MGDGCVFCVFGLVEGNMRHKKLSMYRLLHYTLEIADCRRTIATAALRGLHTNYIAKIDRPLD
jgi:hypothetical protein